MSLACHFPRSMARLWVVLLLLPATGAEAVVLAVEVLQREPLLEGKVFGRAGAYELLQGRVHFGFSPGAEANERITDLRLAPQDEDGLVRAQADLTVLQPVDPKKRRGIALVDVPNRGFRLALTSLNHVALRFGDSAELDPQSPEPWGDGFLMEQGLTIIWVGWQADAPRFPGSMAIDVPAARQSDGSAVRGPVRADWVVEEPSTSLPLAAMGHRPHLPSQPASKEHVLTRRLTREGERETVPREQWRFSEDGTAIEGSFEPAIYELVYSAEGPPLVGLGFAAFRDVAAYAKHDDEALFPVKRAVAMGSSQSGRFLRHFLYEGFNRDEAGRRVYEGVIVNIAGAGRGGFNHRFSHPGRVGNPFRNFFYPGDDFPFASRPLTSDGRTAGLLDRARASDTAPKLFQINTGYEYWGRAAALVHMTPDGSRDVQPLEDERIYHLASAPHYPMPFPPAEESEVEPGIYRGSAVDTSYVSRALLLHMLSWVENRAAPPPSQLPRIAQRGLLPAGELDYPITTLRAPRAPHVAYRLDFGKRFEAGIIDRQPPGRGPAYAMKVPAIDELGNERTGIPPLELLAPIGTYTPWARRTGHAVGEDEMADFVGTFIPLARTTDEARQRGDRRPSLAELYADQAAYEKRVDAGIEALRKQGFMLERDRARARTAAMQRWEWITR